uniref:SPRY domain-containing protein n=1 Tax=Haptolina brevifila TaxID=156173 RepID=A0A7S2DQK9_9EUKA|mmetsp:Transcript_4152/g.9028  ORF Transcript_4152/g.9028 Transcript_4152/m.9028 type:complete len:180 (+) Transcript_4152:147-686(+)
MGCCTSKDDDLPPAFDPIISLSDKMAGPGITVRSGSITGTGSIMGDSPILQDKAYFEVTVVRTGTFAVGVATKDVALDGVLSQDKVATAWTLTSSQQGVAALGAGDTIGVAFDQGDYPVQLYFYRDGKVVHQLSGIRGEVLAVFSVSDGAVLEPNFGGKPYLQGMPPGFQGIIKSMSLL